MQRKPLIVGNWKMQTTLPEALILTSGVKEGVAGLTGIEVVLCPPFPWLVSVHEELHRFHLSHLKLGAQNLFWAESGAYTGEVSAAMLKGIVSYVIIGHSERRHYFHETNAEIAKKVKLAIAAGLRPILCVGELKKPSATLLADPSELTHSQLRQPLSEVTAVWRDLSREEREQLVVAYEPVWAIGSGAAATGLYAQTVAEMIKDEVGGDLPVLYGGSVTPENAREFLGQSAIDGLLVGGASLKVESFVGICRAAA